jgi:hypothetical protein
MCMPTAEGARIDRGGAGAGGINMKRGVGDNETEYGGEGSY